MKGLLERWSLKGNHHDTGRLLQIHSGLLGDNLNILTLGKPLYAHFQVFPETELIESI